jgi:uncharacterized membrane protein YgaE (UPF0421/DUF939 family)
MIIGARVFKTGLAVAFSLWLGELLHLDSPILAAVTAIFAIQPSIHRSWIEMIEQIQSNALGAAIAIAVVQTNIGVTPVTVGLTCIGVILLCVRLKTKNTVGLTLVTVVIIMEAHGQGWPIALDRLAGVLTGIVTAFVVNVTVAPPRLRDRFVRKVQEVETLMSRLLRTSVSNELKQNVFREEYKLLRSKMRQLEEHYEMFAEEREFRKKARAKRARILLVYKGMLTSLERGIALIEAVEEHYFAVTSDKEWNRLVDKQIEALCVYREQLLWKWQGKLKSGVTLAAPPPQSSIRLSDLVIEQEDADQTTKVRLLVITSAVFNFEESLHRLEKLMEQWKHRQEQGESAGGESLVAE